MADFKYDDLKKTYNNFQFPRAIIYVNGKKLENGKKLAYGISDIVVENTCGFEANVASFHIFNCFNLHESVFEFDSIKKLVFLGASVVILMGFTQNAREVFRGFISNISFNYFQNSSPGVTVTCMDVKGIMMSGSYVKNMTFNNYSDAVTDVIKNNYGGMFNAAGAGGSDRKSIVTKLSISPTPDKQQSGGGGGSGGQGAGNADTDRTIDFVAESDYEFVVKAAKRFNYEFYSLAGEVIFRKAKSTSSILMELGPATGMSNVDVSFGVSGLVGNVEVRGMNAGDGKVISSKKKINNKISTGQAAAKLVKSVSKVEIDPTIFSKTDADARAEYIAEDISYRFGTLKADFHGIPELTPGRYVLLKLIGKDYNMKFYVTDVIHKMTTSKGYVTSIIAKTHTIDKEK